MWPAGDTRYPPPAWPPTSGQPFDEGRREHHDRLGDAKVVLGGGPEANDDAKLGGGLHVDVLGADDRAASDGEPRGRLQQFARVALADTGDEAVGIRRSTPGSPRR